MTDIHIAKLEAKIDHLTSVCVNANKLLDEIMPQAGRLVFQNYALLNETLMALSDIVKNAGPTQAELADSPVPNHSGE